MDDGQWVAIFIAVVIGVIALFLRALRAGADRLRERREQKEEVRLLVEKRFVDLMIEFPELSDLALATVMRDELQNRRIQDGEFFRWATADTAGRIRRTLVIAAERAHRKNSLTR